MSRNVTTKSAALALWLFAACCSANAGGNVVQDQRQRQNAVQISRSRQGNNPLPSGQTSESNVPEVFQFRLPNLRRGEVLRALDYAPDQTWVVVASNADVRQIPVAAGNENKGISLGISAHTVRFSPGNKTSFAVGQDRSLVSIYRIGADEPHLKFKAHKSLALPISGLEYSPDGNRLAVRSRGFYSVRDTATGDELFGDTLATSASSGCIAFSPDGRSLAITGKDPKTNKSHVRILSATDGKEQRRIEFSPGFANAISFTPDGKRLVLTGGYCVPVPRDKATYPNSCDPTGYIWMADVDSTEPMQRITPATRHGYFRGASVTADGKNFFTAAPHYGSAAPTSPLSAQLRSTTTGQVVWSRPLKGSGVNAAVLSPDKKTASILSWRSAIHLNASNGTPQSLAK